VICPAATTSSDLQWPSAASRCPAKVASSSLSTGGGAGARCRGGIAVAQGRGAVVAVQERGADAAAQERGADVAAAQ
jgi:hypothetical protein